jgi:hypothetical protein
MLLAALGVLADGLILAWLVGTWFYEGHHRRCTVIVRCPKCGEQTSTPCSSGGHPS